MIKKVLFINSLILCICSIYIFPQSEIPKGTDNYFQVISQVSLGGRDLVNVVFYEVPDTITAPLYFAIKDPEGNNIAPDQGDFNINTTYTLVGGPGTLSDADSRQDVYSVPATHHLKGTTLAKYIYNNTLVAVRGENPENNDDWVYFPGVLPSQGEHIGNKYYFKIVAECDLDAVNIFINGYKLNVSLDNGLGKVPTGVTGVRAFSYSWMICLNDNPPVNVWDIYPFVPDLATDDIEFNSFDMDGQESSVAYAVNRAIFEAVPSSGDNITATHPITINPTADYRNGTWQLAITEGTAGPIMLNTAEFWFTNSISNEVYRAYAEEFTLTAADHIAVDAADGTAIAGGTDSETITLQVVDSSGNPLPYSRMIYVEVLGTAVINNRNGTPIADTGAIYVTTDSNGLGTVSIVKNSVGDELVTIRVWTNGSDPEGNNGNESDLPEIVANETVDVQFVDNLLPEISSTSNLTFTEGNPRGLHDIRITDSGNVDITIAGDIRIKIPDSLDAVFNPIAVIPTVTGVGTVDPVQYEAGNTIAFFQVTGAFDITDTIEISGLALTAANSVSSGYLEASFDNGATYDVTDDKLIRILSSTPTYVWDGSTSNAWNEITNWANDEMPIVPTDNVIIPNVAPNFMPTITNANETINNLAIDAGATLTLGSNNFTISGIMSNNGNLITNGYNMNIGIDAVGTGAINCTGGGTLTVGGDWDIQSFTPGIGTVVFNSTSNSFITSNGQSFNNIEINKTAATATLGDAMSINGDLTITAGTFDVSTDNYQITIAGNWNSIGTFEPENGTVYFNGTSTLQSAETFYNCTINNAGQLSLNGNNLTVSNLFDIIGSGILYRTGNETGPTDTNSGNVIYQDAVGGQIQDYAGAPGNDYYNLEIGGTGIFTIIPGSELTIANTLSVSAGTLNATGATNIRAQGDVTFSGTGSFTRGTGIFYFDGGSGKILHSNNQNLGNITTENIAGNAVTLSDNLICTSLTLSPNTELITGNNNLIVNGILTCEGTITPTTGNITARGNVDFTNGSFQKGSGTFTFGGGTTKNFYGNGQDFGNVTIANILNNVTIIQADVTMDTLSIAGGNAQVEINRASQAVGLTINDGESINNSGTLRIIGGGTNNATIRSHGPGTFSYTGNGIEFNGNDLHLGGLNTYDPGITLGFQEGIIIDTTSTFNNPILLNDLTAEFTVSPGQIAATTDDAITITNGTLTIGADSTLNVGIADISSAGIISSEGDIVCNDFTSTGIFDNPGINTIEASGNVSLSGTFQDTPTNNTLTMIGSGTTIDAAYQIGNLRLLTTGAGTISITNNDLDCAGTLTIEANATLNLDSNDLFTHGTLTCRGILDADQDETLNAWGNVNFGSGNFIRGIPTTGFFYFRGASTKNFYPFNLYIGAVTLEPTLNNIVVLYQNAIMDTLSIGANAIIALNGSLESITLTINDGFMINNSGTFRVLDDTNMVYLYSTPGDTFGFTGNDIDYNGNRINLGMLTSYEPEINLGANEEIFINETCHFDNNIIINGNNALFTINTTHEASTADNNITITNGNLTINEDAILDIGAGALFNGDTITNNGSIICGNFSSTATYNNSGDNSIQAGGDVIITGLFSAPLTDNTLILTGNPGTIDAVPQIGNLEVNAPGGTVSIINHDLSLEGTLLITDTTTFDMTNQDLLITETATIHGILDFSNNGILLNLMNQLVCDGTIIATGNGNINAYGDINITGGTFNGGTGTLTLPSGGLQEITADTQNLGIIHITTDNTEIRLLDNLTCNSLTIDLNTFLDINGNSLNLPAVNFANNGTLYRTGAVGENAPVDNNSGIVAYRGAAGGTIQQYGGVDDYYILDILGSGTFSLAANTQVTLDLEIIGGTFSLGGQSLSIERNFSHDSINSTFSHSNGEVLFINNAIESEVSGDNEFFNFTCNTPGKIIKFVTNQRQTIIPGGTFFIHGTEGNEIRLLETIDIEDENRWIMDARVGCTIDILHVIVEDSLANPEPIIVPDFVFILNCVNWVRYAYVEDSWTEDTDRNGKIDRIGVEVMNNLSLNDNFTNLYIEIQGYELTDNPYTTGDNPIDNNDDTFYFQLVEKSELDTDATPIWWITSTNHSLMDDLTETRIVTSGSEADGGEIADDHANPLISYTLAIADQDEIFICFSEPVKSPGGGEITAADFIGYSGGASISDINRITYQGSGTKEVIILLSANVTANEVFNEAFITTTALEDKAGLTLISQTHRVTDLGLGLTNNGIIEPIWAQDKTIRDLDDEGIGYISLFDNSEWLQDQDITLQARINDDIPGLGIDIRLHFDVNVGENSLKNNLWLPIFDTSEYNGIIPFANEAARELSVSPENIVSEQLRNFIIPENDSEIKSDARVEFLLEIPSIRLYCARVINPGSTQWYRTLCPWIFSIHDIINQKSNVTILNNVINPNKGEKTYLHYILPKAGSVTITVFDLAGDIIDILYKGRQSKGEYSVDWNGKNRGERIVARGIYFIKIAAPEIEEIRKVLVVK